MAKITQEDIEYVANLAQLTLDNDAKERLRKEMAEILSYMDKLNELDTSNVEPMMHVQKVTNIFREDVAGESLDRQTALSNAPKADDEYFLVPRILE